MFLKSIEIRGFKSFADKTELTFKNGITAVVGPNGSGKSNISDAVRWVLGEQSVKNLRGDKMEDVIFAGTQFRKPVGLAQVSLTLDNADSELAIDYSDVTISRRLYRSGDSEYLINNTLCRLKDVQQLFMDTGIGKEGYSIIGQGKIDAILSGKPEDRRKLLEEAAGIVKYKTRKEESEKRLDNTEQNLIRINDILDTYEERLEPLKNESEKAKRFLKLSEELKLKEVNVIIDFIDKVEDRINTFKNECSIINNNISSYYNEKLLIKQQSELWGKELEEFETKSSGEKQRYYDSKSFYQNLNSEIAILKEREDNLSKFIQKTLDEVSSLKVKSQEVKSLKEKLQANLEQFNKTQLELKENIKLREDEINSLNDSMEQENLLINNYKTQNIKLSKDILEYKNKIIIINNDVENITREILRLKDDNYNYSNSIKINTNTKLMLENECVKLKSKIDNYENEVRENKKQIGKFKITLASEEKHLKESNIKGHKLEANLNVLINLEKQYEGYNKSVKILMQHINEGKVNGVYKNCFILGEVIKVEKKLETAIEISLGAAISNIITEDEYNAKTLINYLKEKNIGRATFLPLNIIKGQKLNLDKSISSIKGFIGIASELIGYDNKFKNVIEYSLGKTIVASDMDSALLIAKNASYKFRIVTLSGEIINPGGSLTGGSVYAKATSIIGRKREIEEIEVELKTLNEKIISYTNKVKYNNDEIKRLDDINLNLRDEIHFENIELTKIQGKISSILEETLKLKIELNKSQEQILKMEQRLKTGEKELEIVNNKIEGLTLKEKEYEVKVEEINSTLKDKIDKIEKCKELLTEYKINKAQIDETIINKTSEIERLTKEIIGYNDKVNTLNKEVQEAHTNKGSSLESIKANEQKMKDITVLLETMEKSFENNEIERIKIKERIKQNVDKLENIVMVLDKNDKELHKYELLLTKIETERDALYVKLNEEFELTYAEALAYKTHIDDIEKLKKDISSLKMEISNLGIVNVGAIEEYKDVSEKFAFMNAQREDLIKAKEELVLVIQEMTEKMRVVFKDNFEKLRENFNITFRELFKGGSADLILCEGDELTSKIDINVEPPGKKLQNINLMSGGEKVLSAIALLFAILKMKPTPFCILDEIEAALDDANVVRYAEFLNKFSNNIQFIVITHRKGTMEASDMLYGVTMEEKGVSKIVSVELGK